MIENKRIRRNIIDLKKNYPEEFGKFIISLKSLMESDDWFRITGIHGLQFKEDDPYILCPSNPKVVSELTGFKEPMYCPHGVSEFLAWHTVYLLEFEYMLNKHNKSINKDFISLPWLDLSNIQFDDVNFMSEPIITIIFDSTNQTIPNPLYQGYIYKKNNLTFTKRRGWIYSKRFFQKNIMNYIHQELMNSFHITNYESLSSTNINKKRNTITNSVPLETPHGNCHITIGGIGGSMSNIHTAAFDPIFWLHHCNIDRYFYLWIEKNTNNFTKYLSSDEILPETLELKLAPFFPNQNDLINTDNFNKYKFGWENNSNTYIKIKDILNFEKLNYKYESIIIKKNIIWEPIFVELVNIPIPIEPIMFNLFIIPNNINFDILNDDEKENYLAGNASWFGINRTDTYCERCNSARTNININISTYFLSNNINKKNINNYNIILNGHGLSIEDANNEYKIYTQNELVRDGSIKLILDEHDFILNKDFKFDEKSVHTKIFQSIIIKLNKLNYGIELNTDWNEIMNIKNKFESDWKMTFEHLIKLKPLDKINNNIDNEQIIYTIKNEIIKNYLKKTKFNIDYIISDNFATDYSKKIIKCIEEWKGLMISNNILISFNQITNQNINLDKYLINFDFISIDGEYQVCGNTYSSTTNSNIINIDIDKDENYKIEGLFELIIKHEIGHAFGLDHSSNPNSIMYPFINNLNKVVSIIEIKNILN
jgi:predicted Zn-dependent protease